ncbi:MAG: UMP kinase, partial [Spirochaetales bacterium]|nr:UMP kinase [Spirochaetales bacterium]
MSNASTTTIVSLGGSLVAPSGVAVDFLAAFHSLVVNWLDEVPGRRLVLIVGGGAPARVYQEAYRSLCPQPQAQSQDWIGIMATRLNAQLVKALFEKDCPGEVVTDPLGNWDWNGRVLVAAGWKPGFSTDFD